MAGEMLQIQQKLQAASISKFERNRDRRERRPRGKRGGEAMKPWNDTDVMMFFDPHPAALPLFKAFAEKLYELYPASEMRVQKTQITFSNRHVFACVSFLRIKKKAELPDPYLVVTLGLSFPLASHRVAAKTEAYPGRWTTHIVIGAPSEIDSELMEWVRLAYDFSESK